MYSDFQMAFDIWGGYLAYVIGYGVAAAFLIAYRRDLIGRSTVRTSREKYRHAEAA